VERVAGLRETYAAPGGGVGGAPVPAGGVNGFGGGGRTRRWLINHPTATPTTRPTISSPAARPSQRPTLVELELPDATEIAVE
jgi:hypothetical protein